MLHEPTGVDVVVVSYKTPRDLDEFLQSFADHTPTIPWTLHIVNVDPVDEDRQVASRWSAVLGERATLLEFDSNVGYGVASNTAAAVGNYETIVLFNADILLTAGAIDQCCAALMAHDEWAILGPRQIDQHGRITHAGIFGTLDKPAHRGWHAIDDGQYTDILEGAISVSGSAYFIKRSVWDYLTNCPRYRSIAPTARGALLESQLYYEETWASVHAIAHGHRVVFYGPVTIVHRWHQAVQQNGLQHWSGQVMKESHELYRTACRSHGIPTD